MDGFGDSRLTGSWVLTEWGRRQWHLPEVSYGHPIAVWLALRETPSVVPDPTSVEGLELTIHADGTFEERGTAAVTWYDPEGVQERTAKPYDGALGQDRCLYPNDQRRWSFDGQILRLFDDVKIVERLRWHAAGPTSPERLLRVMTAVIDDQAVDRIVYVYHRKPDAEPPMAVDGVVPPLLRKPARGKKPLPDLWKAHGPLRLRYGGQLAPDHLERLGRALMASQGHDTEALKEVRHALVPADRDAFGLALYEACVASVKPPPWLIRSLTLFAGEACVERLFQDAPQMKRASYLIVVEVLGEVADAHAAQRLLDLAAWIGDDDFRTFALVQLDLAIQRGAPIPEAPRPRDALGWA